jgi:hypothetical protein
MNSFNVYADGDLFITLFFTTFNYYFLNNTWIIFYLSVIFNDYMLIIFILILLLNVNVITLESEIIDLFQFYLRLLYIFHSFYYLI